MIAKKVKKCNFASIEPSHWSTISLYTKLLAMDSLIFTDSWCGIKLHAGVSPLDSGNLLPAARLGYQSQSKSQESDYLMILLVEWPPLIGLPCHVTVIRITKAVSLPQAFKIVQVMYRTILLR